MELIIFILNKSDGIIKGRVCTNGSIQQEWMNNKEVSGSTVALESVIFTTAIGAHE